MAIFIDPISPVAFSVFGLPVRWYALAYIAAFIAGYLILRYLMRSKKCAIQLTKKELTKKKAPDPEAWCQKSTVIYNPLADQYTDLLDVKSKKLLNMLVKSPETSTFTGVRM